MKNNSHTDISDLVSKSTVSQKHASYTPPEKEPPAVAEAGSDQSFEIQEVIEHEPQEKIKEVIAHRKETPHVSKQAKDMGVRTSTPTSFTSTKTIKLPLSDDKVFKGLHAPITSSLRWLAEFCLYLLKKAHLGLKVVHGHVKRVIVK